MRDSLERKNIVAQITRKDIDRYRDDQEKYEAQQLAEQRQQEEDFLRYVRKKATDLGRQLKSSPRWMRTIEKLRSEVLHALATDTLQRVKTVTTTVLLSDMSWRWKRKWSRLADRDRCWSSNAASSELSGGLLEGGLKNCLETILPLNRVYCHRTGSTRWELIVEFLPPKD